MRAAPKVATNLSARADIVSEAKDLGLNLSEVFESAVAEAIKRRRQELWLEQNQEAIDSYNARVERDGLFGDEWRKF
ncbi:MAG: type II toxin-antitoxin system CcdA family antitoxin [Deltaproteobacteria bacterium]|nr:type II toxin-antitoxin system CcdA family antitoxin [Deltaproteobacteria bacterium]